MGNGQDLFRGRNDKRARARIEIIGRGDPVWSPENDNWQIAIDN